MVTLLLLRVLVEKQCYFFFIKPLIYWIIRWRGAWIKKYLNKLVKLSDLSYGKISDLTCVKISVISCVKISQNIRYKLYMTKYQI